MTLYKRELKGSIKLLVIFAAIMTIPYGFSCSKKISRIKMDNNGAYLKWQKISLIVLGFLDAIILIAYFVVM